MQKKGNPGGKLYSRINYIRQSDRNKVKAEETRQTVSVAPENITTPEILKALTWLNLNRQPWSSVPVHWEITFPDRQHLLKDRRKVNKLLKKYPHIGEEFGFQLVSIYIRILYSRP